MREFLVEARMEAELIHNLILGIGFNVGGDLDSFPEEVRNRATTLSQASDSKVEINEFAAKLIYLLNEAQKAFMQQDLSAQLFREWTRFDYLADKPVTCQYKASD